MSDVTQILSSVGQGELPTAEQLLPLVYDELRKLAAQKMAAEKPGQTLQATALVHEAFVRLSQGAGRLHWESRSHFFAAAAEAMRRILVENARRKKRLKRGGAVHRSPIDVDRLPLEDRSDELLAVHEALARLEGENEAAARLVKLRYFAGFTIPEAAQALDVSPRKANQLWAYARAWLLTAITDDSDPSRRENL